MLASPAEVAAEAAQRIRVRFGGADAFRVAFSGGSTPVRLYDLLAVPPWRDRLDWSRFHVFFADERAVPPDHSDSNYRIVHEHLLSRVPIPATQVFRMHAEEPLDRAASEYEALVATAPLDMVVLGMGPDGHVASLFPGSGALHERVRRVLPILDSPKPPARRMTLTSRTLSEAREVLVLVTGAEKAGAVALALEAGTSPQEVPARLVRDRHWLIDEAAAAAL